MAISGTSAGGNLALAAALSGRLERLAGLALFYGVFGADLDTASYRRFADGRFGLSRERMAYFLEQYDPTGRHRADPLLQPLLAELTGLPPTWLLAAGLDVLRRTLALHSRLIERACARPPRRAGRRARLHQSWPDGGAARRSLDGAAISFVTHTGYPMKITAIVPPHVVGARPVSGTSRGSAATAARATGCSSGC